MPSDFGGKRPSSKRKKDLADEAARRMKKSRKKGKITEDDPRWNPKTMGNKRGEKSTPYVLSPESTLH